MFVPIVLTTILEHPKNEYIVYTDLEGVYKLFNEFALPNAQVLRYYGANTIHSYNGKKAMIIQLKEYHIDSITFYHTEYGEYANWLISKYSQRVKIFFQPPYEPWNLKPSYDIRSLKRKIITYLVFGYNPDILLVGTKRYVSMAKSFYINNKVERIEAHVNRTLITKFVRCKYDYDDKSSIVWLDGAIKAGGIEPNKYQEITDTIICSIGKDRVYSKCHPRFNDLYGIEKDIKQIPSYIPISLLLDSFDTFIGYWSTALVEAAIAGKKAISTIYIMPQTQQGRVEIEKKVLDDKLNGNGIIYYPKSFEELIALVKK